MVAKKTIPQEMIADSQFSSSGGMNIANHSRTVFSLSQTRFDRNAAARLITAMATSVIAVCVPSPASAAVTKSTVK